MKHYIYIYCDPRKKGMYSFKYKHLSFKFKYEPFYVGKGNGQRTLLCCVRNKWFTNKVNKLKRLGLEPILFKHYVANHKAALTLEKFLIRLIGRKDLKKGYLVNLTMGGEGSLGRKVSKATRRKISKARKGIPLSKEAKRNVRLAAKKRIGTKCSKEAIKNMSIAQKKRFKETPRSEETNAKLSNSLKGREVWNKGAKYTKEQKVNFNNQFEKGNIPHNKNIYFVKSPNGKNWLSVIYLEEFCNENKLNVHTLKTVAYRKNNSVTKGKCKDWQCKVESRLNN